MLAKFNFLVDQLMRVYLWKNVKFNYFLIDIADFIVQLLLNDFS